MELSVFKYTCSGGETFDSVARTIYGDENYAAELLCANPELCRKQMFLGGEELFVPIVEVPENEDADMTATEAGKAPWRE